MDELQSARRFWDSEVAAPTHSSWMAHPTVREYINRLISGSESEGLWPIDWFERTYPGRRFALGLSIGCGTGALERDVLKRGLCERMEAFDASPASLGIARAEAAAAGIEQRVDYRDGDFNRVTLKPRAYDIVFFHQSLHHVSRLERILWQVLRALKPGGLLYLDEFVGPSRHYWNKETIQWYSAMYQYIPRHMRFFDEFAMPVQYDDLSEAIRSGEIRSRLRIGYDVLHERGYGGNVLAMMFPDVDVSLLTSEIVDEMIRSERSLLASGMPSFHAIIVAEPKRGAVARAAAAVRYFVEPKLKRILRELQPLLPRRKRGEPWF